MKLKYWQYQAIFNVAVVIGFQKKRTTIATVLFALEAIYSTIQKKKFI